MKIIIKTKNLELTSALEDFIYKKIGMIKKFINVLKREDEVGKTLAEVFVEVEKETKHHNKGQIFSCQVEIKLPGRSLLAKANSDDLYKAIVEARKEIEAEIKKYKFKNIDKNRREQRKYNNY
ncbi:MAG: ribosome-associated translation inhibitor RaiA [Candidatus Staskawiczbacteria bacterium]|nr:ribosome-associated translation inhibitor RaiA [Candidatus Staskawiczbacteria bacterium]